MKPERISELLKQCLPANGMHCWTRIRQEELADLLYIAEREAKLREVIETAIEDLIDGDAFVIDRLRAALESKGGD